MKFAPLTLMSISLQPSADFTLDGDLADSLLKGHTIVDVRSDGFAWHVLTKERHIYVWYMQPNVHFDRMREFETGAKGVKSYLMAVADHWHERERGTPINWRVVPVTLKDRLRKMGIIL